MRPNEKSEYGNSYRRKGYSCVSKDAFFAEARDDFRDDSHSWQDHDIYGRVRIKPEEVLKEKGVTTLRWIEYANSDYTLEYDEHHRYGNYRCRQNKDDGRCVIGPYKQWQPEPRHAGCSHLVDRDDEVEAGENRRKASDENAHCSGNHIGVHIVRAQRCRKCPSCVYATCNHHVELNTATNGEQ